MKEWNEAVAYSEKHPFVLFGVVMGAGLLVLWYYGYLSPAKASGGSSSDATLGAAFYSAEASQTASGNALLTAQVNATRDTAIAGLNDDAKVAIQQAWTTAGMYSDLTSADTSIHQSDNDVLLAQLGYASDYALAPYALASDQITSNTSISTASIKAHGESDLARISADSANYIAQQQNQASITASNNALDIASLNAASSLLSHTLDAESLHAGAGPIAGAANFNGYGGSFEVDNALFPASAGGLRAQGYTDAQIRAMGAV